MCDYYYNQSIKPEPKEDDPLKNWKIYPYKSKTIKPVERKDPGIEFLNDYLR